MKKQIVLLSVVWLALSWSTAAPFIFRTMWNANSALERFNEMTSEENIEKMKESARRSIEEQKEWAAKEAEKNRSWASEESQRNRDWGTERQSAAQESVEKESERNRTWAERQRTESQEYVDDKQARAEETAKKAKEELKAERERAEAALSKAKEDLKAERARAQEEWNRARQDLQSEIDEAKARADEEVAAAKQEWEASKENIAQEYEEGSVQFQTAMEDAQANFEEEKQAIIDAAREREEGLKAELEKERAHIHQGVDDLEQAVKDRENAIKEEYQAAKDAGATEIEEAKGRASQIEEEAREEARKAKEELAKEREALKAELAKEREALRLEMEEMKKMREEMKEEARRMREEARSEYQAGKDKVADMEQEARDSAARAREYAQRTDEELREEARAARDRIKADYEKAGEAVVDSAQRRAASQFAQSIDIDARAPELIFFLKEVEEGSLAHVLSGEGATELMGELYVIEQANLLKAKRRLKERLLDLKERQLAQVDAALDDEAFAAFKENLNGAVVATTFDDELSSDVARLLVEFDGGYYKKYLDDNELRELKKAREDFRDDLLTIVHSRVSYLGSDLSSFTTIYANRAAEVRQDVRDFGNNALLLGRYEAMQVTTDELKDKIIIPDTKEGLKAVQRLIREYKIKVADLGDDLKEAGLTSKAMQVPKWVDEIAFAYLKAYTNAVVRLGLWTQWRVVHVESEKVAASVREYETAVGNYEKSVNSKEVKGHLGADVVNPYLDEIKEATATLRTYQQARKEGGEKLAQKKAEITRMRRDYADDFDGMVEEAVAEVDQAVVDALATSERTGEQGRVLAKFKVYKYVAGDFITSARGSTANFDQVRSHFESVTAKGMQVHDDLQKEERFAAGKERYRVVHKELQDALTESQILFDDMYAAYAGAYFGHLQKEANRVAGKIEDAELSDIDALVEAFESKAAGFEGFLERPKAREHMKAALREEYERKTEEMVKEVQRVESDKRGSEIAVQERTITVSSR